METDLLIIGKDDYIITMILDNLYSQKNTQDITVYNYMNLLSTNAYEHDQFNVRVCNKVQIEDFEFYIMGTTMPKHKIYVIKHLKLSKNKFMNVIHASLDCSHTSRLGRGVLINSKVSIAAQAKIGDFVSINRHVSIGHHTTISDYCSINPGVNIAGRVNIGEGTLIGMGTNIVDNIKIGKNCVIGAGSLVLKDIPDNTVAYGSPCKIIRDKNAKQKKNYDFGIFLTRFRQNIEET
jgi:sugar O-acyltransferase (sialic acid O-acetyltransferase NeuD family)